MRYRSVFLLLSFLILQGLVNAQILKDFMTDAVLGTIEKDQASFSLTVPEKDAYLVKIIPVNTNEQRK